MLSEERNELVRLGVQGWGWEGHGRGKVRVWGGLLDPMGLQLQCEGSWDVHFQNSPWKGVVVTRVGLASRTLGYFQ